MDWQEKRELLREQRRLVIENVLAASGALSSEDQAAKLEARNWGIIGSMDFAEVATSDQLHGLRAINIALRRIHDSECSTPFWAPFGVQFKPEAGWNLYLDMPAEELAQILARRRQAGQETFEGDIQASDRFPRWQHEE